MKTAVEDIFEYLETFGMMLHEDTKYKFKQKIKQQIIDAHSKGQQWNKSEYNPGISEQYYKETYETKESH